MEQWIFTGRHLVFTLVYSWLVKVYSIPTPNVFALMIIDHKISLWLVFVYKYFRIEVGKAVWKRQQTIMEAVDQPYMHKLFSTILLLQLYLQRHITIISSRTLHVVQAVELYSSWMKFGTTLINNYLFISSNHSNYTNNLCNY